MQVCLIRHIEMSTAPERTLLQSTSLFTTARERTPLRFEASHRSLPLSSIPPPAIKLHASQRFLQHDLPFPSPASFCERKRNPRSDRSARSLARGVIESRASTVRHRTPRTLFPFQRGTTLCRVSRCFSWTSAEDRGRQNRRQKKSRSRY